MEGYPPPAEPDSPPSSSSPGCTLIGPWEVAQPRELKFRPEGKSFATFPRPREVELRLVEARPVDGKPVDRKALVSFADMTSDRARLWGHVASATLGFHAARPYVLEGHTIPGPQATLRWIGFKDGKVEVRVGLPTAAGARSATGDRACEDLSLAEVPFNPREAVPEPTLATGALVGGPPVSLLLRPGGSRIAELSFPAGAGPMLDVIARSPTHLRVVVARTSLNPADDVLLVGWVARSAVENRLHGSGGSWAASGHFAFGGQPRGEKRVACAGDVPLVASLDNEAHLVGVIVAGVPIDLVTDPGAAGDASRKDDLVEVRLREAQVIPAEGARFLVKRGAVAACPTAP